MKKCEIPIINNLKPLPVVLRMKIYCQMAQADINKGLGCKGIECDECIFNPKHKEQFLVWERMIKQTGEK